MSLLQKSDNIYDHIQQPGALQEEGNLAVNWKEWKSAFDFFLITSGRNSIPSKEKCAMLLHVIGKFGREIYKEFDVDDKIDYERLVKLFTDRFDPKRNIHYERHIFFETYQTDSFDEFLSELKIKSKSCEFGPLINSLILTQIIRGLKDAQIRERLLSRASLELEEAVQCCRKAHRVGTQAAMVRTGPAESAATPLEELMRDRGAPSGAGGGTLGGRTQRTVSIDMETVYIKAEPVVILQEEDALKENLHWERSTDKDTSQFYLEQALSQETPPLSKFSSVPVTEETRTIISIKKQPPTSNTPQARKRAKLKRTIKTARNLNKGEVRNTKKKTHPCDICNKEFMQLGHLEVHKRTHMGIKPFSCIICKKDFRQVSHLEKHKRVHTGFKPYSCEICPKKFSQLSNLKAHVFIHTGEKPYSCEFCEKKFTQLCNLKIHSKIHSGLSAKTCDVCGEAFTGLISLKRHKQTHMDERPYSCDICKERFKQLCHLKTHARTHTGEKPFSCEICHRKFSESHILKRHQHVHTGVKPYSCDMCEKKFTQLSNLKRHVNQTHT